MAEITAGSGDNSVVLKLDADASQYERALDRAADAMREWETRTKQALERASATADKESAKQARSLRERVEAINNKVDQIGGLFGLSFKAAIADLAAEAGKSFVELISGADRMKKALEELEKGYTVLGDVIAKNADKRAEWLDRGAGRGDTLANVDKELANLKRMLAEESKMLADAKKAREEAGFRGFDAKPSDALDVGLRWLGGTQADTLAMRDAAVSGSEATTKDLTERVNKLEEMRLRLADPSKDPEFVRSINETIAGLEKQLSTWSMTAEEVARYELKLKGASEAQLKMFEEAQKHAATGALLKSVKDAEDALQKQIDTFGMSADAIALYELKLKGATDSELEWLRAMQERLGAMRKEDELRKAAEAEEKRASDWGRAASVARGGSSAAAEAVAAARRSTAAAARTPDTSARAQLAALQEANKLSAKQVAEQEELTRTMKELSEDLRAAFNPF